MENLSNIAESQPQAAYAAYTKGYKSKFVYFQRTIEDFEDFLKQKDDLLESKLIPALFGDGLPELPRELLALNPNEGGIGIQILSEESKPSFEASEKITSPHVESIITHDCTLRTCDSNDRPDNQIRDEYHKERLRRRKEQIKQTDEKLTDEKLTDEQKLYVEQARDNGASSWLNTLPIHEQQLDLSKTEFRDALHLRYNLPLKDLPTQCPCGERFNVSHALSCKKGGFVAQRHDNLRDLLTHLLSKICKDVEAEPHLTPVTTEQMSLKTANTRDEARLDIKAIRFWQRGQNAFFDLRVTHVNSSYQKSTTTDEIFKIMNKQKKENILSGC